ncbi:hypothetical protein IKQ21_08200 [bacterium]|nr:hypothetical protein [bacterium]
MEIYTLPANINIDFKSKYQPRIGKTLKDVISLNAGRKTYGSDAFISSNSSKQKNIKTAVLSTLSGATALVTGCVVKENLKVGSKEFAKQEKKDSLKNDNLKFEYKSSFNNIPDYSYQAALISGEEYGIYSPKKTEEFADHRVKVTEYINSLPEKIKNNEIAQVVINDALESGKDKLDIEKLYLMYAITDEKVFENCFENKTEKQQNHNFKCIKYLSANMPKDSLYRSFFEPLNNYLEKGILLNDDNMVDEKFAKSFIGTINKTIKSIKLKKLKTIHGDTYYADYDVSKHINPTILRAAKNEDGTLQSDYIVPAAKLYAKLQTTGIERDSFTPLSPTTMSIHRLTNSEEILYQILKEIKDNTLKNYGTIFNGYMDGLLNRLDVELNSYSIISESKTMERILSPELKLKLGFEPKLADLPLETILENSSREYEQFKTESYENIPLLRYILHGDPSKEELYNFLVHVTADETLGKKLVKEFQTDARIGISIKNHIIETFGGNTEGRRLFDKWYNDDVYGYRKAYSEYYKQEVYEKAKNLMTIVKQSPNIAPWAFLNKAKELGVEPTLGKLPKDFDNLEDFRLLIQELIKLDKETDNHSFKRKYPYYQDIEYFITVNDKKYQVEKLRGGMSAKTKYKVTPENGDSYIIKFNEYDAIGNTWRSTQIRENQAMRADSPYLDALVDFYLKENKCPNTADIKFFDYKSKAVVYKATKGKLPNFDDNLYTNLFIFNNSKLAEDVSSLGIILNDINNGNFIKDKNGKYILVDTGHAEYSHPFRPMIPGIHISLNNLCGRELR